MLRRTKIVCTLGPASSSPEIIRGLVRAGMDVARLNLSHGTHADHRLAIDRVRDAAHLEGRDVPVLLDLQGPKLRVGRMRGDEVEILAGRRLVLTPHPIEESGPERVFVNYPTLARDVEPGSTVLLDDGRLELRILELIGEDVLTEVITGGMLRSRKGVNLPNIRTSTPALTEKDLADLAFGLDAGVDFVALSFVRDETDVVDLVGRVRDSGSTAGIIAKIEKPEAVERFDAILARTDGIMVARGDLGIEMRLSKVPGTQKRIIRKCQVAAKPVITATQMLESMIDHPRPTRAEVSDVANAVLDGTDAVMLSGETAMGHDPVRVVEVMAAIIEEAEKHYRESGAGAPADRSSFDVTEAVSQTAVRLAREVEAVALACLTASGATARSIARHRPDIPVFAFTDHPSVVRQLALTWGTKGIEIPFQEHTDEGIALVHAILRDRGLVRSGDLVVLTAGMPLPERGQTNTVHVSRI